ncbi:hypothetical protein FOZ60_009401 [Perkinsus olseni]|uniref:Uncharacterized protein n=1 Tax=Perkinsus olseni TaxID=32597 RepID=A0A7J6NHL4_PEROL|nr:hypothetical protein FOZ60_009401 [Perkinsus olseni]
MVVGSNPGSRIFRYFFPSEEEDVGFLWFLIAGHRWAWYDFLLRGVTIVGLSGFAQLIFYIPRLVFGKFAAERSFLFQIRSRKSAARRPCGCDGAHNNSGGPD